MRLFDNVKNPLVILLSVLGLVSLSHRRPARHGGDLHHGVAGDRAALRAGKPRRLCRRKAQGHGQHNGHGGARRPAQGNIAQGTGARGYRAAFSRRYGARGCASALGQGPVPQPGGADGRVHAGGEVPAPVADEAQNPLEMSNICFLGSNVESGTGQAVVVQTGSGTYFGSLAGSIVGAAPVDQLRQGHQRLHLADDRLHGRDGADGVPVQWI